MKVGRHGGWRFMAGAVEFSSFERNIAIRNLVRKWSMGLKFRKPEAWRGWTKISHGCSN
jgi:hypothetical protein